MASVPRQSPPPVRHGTARLWIQINGVIYRLRRLKPRKPGEKSWSLTHLGGPRAGTSHVVYRCENYTSCSCEDSSIHGAVCKHMRALVAAGLVSGRGRHWLGTVHYHERFGLSLRPEEQGGA